MKRLITALAVVVGLTTFSLPAFATELRQPVKMTDQQLDAITAGALVEINTAISDIKAFHVDLELEIEVEVKIVNVWNNFKHHGFKPKFKHGKTA